MKSTEAMPPAPPEMKRRVTIYPMQALGMSLIALIPLLALLGVFGEVDQRISTTGASFTVQAEYPARTRHRVFETITITITNAAQQAYESATVEVSEDFIASFAEVAFDVEVDRITPEAYVFQLDDFQPGESRIIGVELRADRYWQQNGIVRVSAPGAEPVELTISMFVFP